jgi:hypothetical protein
MKKIIPLLLLTVSTMALGQNPVSFNDSNAIWTVAKTYPHTNPQNPGFIETSTKLFGYNGDTLIGTDPWLKMYQSPDTNFISNLSYLGNIRETNGVVVYMDTTNSVHTLYDFNLQLGDSVLYSFGFGNYYLKIESIDSIMINSEYHKRFHFQEPSFPPFYLNEVWIQGIGSIHGPLFPANPKVYETEIPDSTYLTCFKTNNSILWNNPNYTKCYINIMLNTEDLTISGIKIFPNPSSDRLFIEFPDGQKSSHDILIYDLQGRLIQCLLKNQFNPVEIDLSALDKGVYIMQIDGAENLKKFKLIKQ